MITQVYEMQSLEEARKMIKLGVDHIGSVLQTEKHCKEPHLVELVQFVKSTGARHSLIPLTTEEDLISRVTDYYQPEIIHFCDQLVHEQGQSSVGNARTATS